MATLPSQYKPSLQTIEGKALVIFNVMYFVGVAAAAVVDIATQQAVFSHYANQLAAITGFILTYNGYFAKLRTNYKTALIALDAPVDPKAGNYAG